MTEVRHNWQVEEILDIYNAPLLKLINRAQQIHHEFNDANEVQVSSLLSIKTGGCVEDCGYCSQAARYNTDVEVQRLMEVSQVLIAADKAKAGGASRLCMGAAWREVRDNSDFDRVLEMVKGVNAKGMEVCCTL